MSTTEQIKEAIARATGFLSDHPDQARYTDSAAVATLDGGLRVMVRDPAGRVIHTDMPKSIGGDDNSPSPGWLFRAAVAACDVTVIAMRAAMLGIEISEIEVTIDGESDDRGIFGLDESVPPGPLTLRTRVRVAAPGADGETLRTLAEWGVAHCPVCDAAKRAVPTEVEIEVG